MGDSAAELSRIPVCVAAVVTIAIGLFGRSVPVVGNALGGIAYTVLIALLTVLVWPRTRPLIAALIGVGLSYAVELLQLTPVPGLLVDAVPPLRWALGTTFMWEDLLWYLAGGAVAFGVIAGLRRTAVHISHRSDIDRAACG